MRARIRAGDPQAFAELFDEYAKTIYNHAYRLTADWSAAEDIVSATFMEAWRGHQRLDAEGGSVRPWLLGIATNLVRAQSRGSRRYRAAATATAAAAGAAAVADHADEVAGRLDDRRHLAATARALAGLRRTEREVLSLCLWQGLDYATAARLLDVPVGTVRSRLSRARKKLRKLADAQLLDAFREPPAVDRQIRGDRTIAARPAQEGTW
ncbi:RNA polymerase sigma factor [Streptomyces fulvorobeus]|uniref:RNA polymerase sigma-70 factor (ECF subfamily) n=1 Tax=Streptomyces fulvorobeus TaxID=284028 RepID=A0A7J0CDL9_9ACTN|nr:RNA polymerase sigma factor [Streptomyces fulvorobeus]NYE43510.1 RNA polymerase sigma-70 factor (ECF subfamily) [Streptomyces fulvorobeus]GFM99983.1 siderophore-interacting protein [Streptomyces fulvorobeus]